MNELKNNQVKTIKILLGITIPSLHLPQNGKIITVFLHAVFMFE